MHPARSCSKHRNVCRCKGYHWIWIGYQHHRGPDLHSRDVFPHPSRSPHVSLLCDSETDSSALYNSLWSVGALFASWITYGTFAMGNSRSPSHLRLTLRLVMANPFPPPSSLQRSTNRLDLLLSRKSTMAGREWQDGAGDFSPYQISCQRRSYRPVDRGGACRDPTSHRSGSRTPSKLVLLVSGQGQGEPIENAHDHRYRFLLPVVRQRTH